MTEFWFCLKHHAVEGAGGCANKHRLGPYASREEAASALETVEERNEAWDNDPRWNDQPGVSGESDPPAGSEPPAD